MDAIEVHIGLGANVGEPVMQFSQALDEMLRRGLLFRPIQKSSFYRSAPWGPVADQPHFINAVVRGKTLLPPHDLLAGLKAVERDLGRAEQTIRWGPRLIDLDLLLYGKVVLNTPGL
ncbi:2-amino-4-hydroxy-6-hydroxymethyldihydropteridine diphosphokinase, partial [Candidatus Sumerlaeota bacterium]|nr:2-amino-4-hydroxy-6-hydroxymethyldihydropteridine diphosphokinase [Candidatus Sumerlaeota bacterium]